jgi:transcriptional regulator with XRE-family HTH domain
MSQAQLARRLAVSTRTVSRWETGASQPSEENWRRAADVLGVPAAFFFEEDK